MSAYPVMSVVVPAHDEEALVERCLRALTAGAGEGEFDIVVVCNGCTDETAARSRRFAEGVTGVRVLETSTASKTAALNLGDGVALSEYRAYVDADVIVSAAALRAVRRVLDEPGVLAAAPSLSVDTAGASWPVRAHYAVWDLSDYRARHSVGSGFYAMSPRGRSRFGTFPDLIADDLFVNRLFNRGERRTVVEETFTVEAPATMASLLRRSSRAAAGNLQWQRSRPGGVAGAGPAVAEEEVEGGPASLVRRLAARPRLWPAGVVYTYAYVMARLRARRKVANGELHVWDRDDTHR